LRLAQRLLVAKAPKPVRPSAIDCWVATTKTT
jgi:hypothetical protein